MGKKTKSKQRLDTYYHYAKAQGYRSRAAYKLIQLNRKYNFLNNSTALVDLCAAPGGWMQVAKQCMPMNSTIIGVDLDPIKKVPGTQSFIGDITTQTCYTTLKKMLKNQKCDVVLNDGAPNVGANWSKDAYAQSELVLSALKLACNFLRDGGFFVTKVFRSTDFQSLMWVFKKFFEKVQATKPKASRFVSAEIFVVCSGYFAPEYIDEKLFDAKFIFKDTQADHYHEQMAGQITNIDKLLQNRRKRGGYEDNAPIHLYKETSVTHFIRSKNPLLIFAEFNKITVSPQQKQQFYPIIRNMPIDMDQMLSDLKVLGKRQISLVMKWRSKILHKEHVEKQKAESTSNVKKVQSQYLDRDDDEQVEIHQLEDHQDQANIDEQANDNEQQDNSSAELQMEVLHQQKRKIRELREKQNKKQQLLVRAELVNKQHNNDQQQGQQFEIDSDVNLQELGYDAQIYEPKPKQKKKVYIDYDAKRLEQNLQQIYETRKAIVEQKQNLIKQKRQARKKRQQQRYHNKQQKLKSSRFVQRQYNSDQQQNHQQRQEAAQPAQVDNEVKFNNPLAEFDDDDIYISENQSEGHRPIKHQKIDPNERMDGQLSDDDAYIIPKPMTDMQKRRKLIKKNQLKKQKKLKQSIVDGDDVGGQIQIVKQRQMEDYDIDSLAETLAIAKKMLRNGPRDQIVQNSYRGYSFEDHDQLPKWFTDDEKKHNFKKDPITKQQFSQQKQRLMAINARIPKKIMQAKVRKKIRMQKKLKKVQKKAEVVMNQQGITEISKLRQVGKMYDKEKRGLKDTKKYTVSKKFKTSKGKDGRNVKHVDSRMKKDKRSQKISKTRQIKRKTKKRGKF